MRFVTRFLVYSNFLRRSSTPVSSPLLGLQPPVTCTQVPEPFVSSFLNCIMRITSLNSSLDGLALSGNAPRIFLKTSKNGLPFVAIIFCSFFALLAYMAAGSATAGKVFGWFQNLTSIAGLMTWFGIGVTYLRFHKGFKLQGFDRTGLPYASKLQPFAGWYVVIACPVICFVSLACFLDRDIVLILFYRISSADSRFS